MSLKLLGLLIVAVVFYAHGQDVDTRFLGLGYNILQGNPDGDFQGPSGTGTDPGIKSLRRILSVTDDQVESIPRSSCKETETVYENSEKYQEKLSLEINVEAGASYAGVSFSASAGFKQANEQTTESETVVFERIKLCKQGGVRYHEELVHIKDYTIDDSFAAAVCRLPVDYNSNSKATYMNFISTWGTHVTTTVYLGTKEIERSEATRTSVLEFAEENYSAAVSLEGSVGGFGGSLSVDVDYFRSDESFKSQFSSNKATYTIGTDDLPEPIQLSLHDIRNVLKDKYWSHLDQLKRDGYCNSNFVLSHMESQMDKALQEYPQYIETYPVNHDNVVVPLAWPQGTFGLVKAGQFGCPEGTWSTGRICQTVGSDTTTTPSDKYYLATGFPYYGDGKYGYCWNYCMMLHQSGSYRRSWPKGSYCIFKKGSCPSGFQEGFIFIDDHGLKKKFGYYPDGEYGDSSTKFKYCCRNDEFPVHKIYLPTALPFVLQPTTQNCQEVHGMKWKKITVFIDGHGSSKSKSDLSPYDEMSEPDDHSLLFCLYSTSAHTFQ